MEEDELLIAPENFSMVEEGYEIFINNNISIEILFVLIFLQYPI